VTVRAVFFDVFGTLMPYKNLPRHEVLAKRANLVGLSLTPAQVLHALETLEQNRMGFAMAGQLAGEDVPRDRTYWVRTFGNVLTTAGIPGDQATIDRYATDMCDTFLQVGDFFLDEETLPTLRGLKQQGFLVAVISNAPKGLAKTLAEFGVLQELAFAVGSQDIGIEKPDPAIFDYALRATGVSAAEAAYVGDEYMTDARAAQAVGMLGIFLDRNGLKPVSDVPRIRRLTDLLGPDSPLHTRR
jgi:HAD superfamily hydrolase (TIGR01549 family)